MSSENTKTEEPRVVLTRLQEDSKTDFTETPSSVRRSKRRLSTTSDDLKVEEAPKSLRKSTRRLSAASEEHITEDTPIRKTTRRLSTASEEPIAEETVIQKNTRRLSAASEEPVSEEITARKRTRRLSAASEEPVSEEITTRRLTRRLSATLEEPQNSLRRSSRSTSVLQRNVLEEKTAALTPKKRLTRRNSDISDPGTVNTVTSPSVTRGLRSRKTVSDNEDSVQPVSTPIKKRESRRLTNILHEDENTLQTIEEKENIENLSLTTKPLEVIKENLRKSFSAMENENSLVSNSQSEPSTSPKKTPENDQTITKNGNSHNNLNKEVADVKDDDKTDNMNSPKNEKKHITSSHTPKIKDNENENTLEKQDGRETRLNTPKDDTPIIEEKTEVNDTSRKGATIQDTSPQNDNKETDNSNLETENEANNSPKKENGSKTPSSTRLNISKNDSEENTSNTSKEENPNKEQYSMKSDEDQDIKESSQKEIDLQTATPTVRKEQKVESPKIDRITRSSISKLDEEINNTPTKETIRKEESLNTSKTNEHQQKITETSLKEIDCNKQSNTSTDNEEQQVGDSPKGVRTTRSSISKLNADENINDTPKKETVSKEQQLSSPSVNKETPLKEIGRKTQPNTPITRSGISKLDNDENISSTPKKDTIKKTETETNTPKVIKEHDDSPKSERKTRSSNSKLNNDEEVGGTPKKETDSIEKQLDSSTVNDHQKINTTPQKGICQTQSNTPTSNEENKIDDSPKSDRKTRSSISKLKNDEEVSDTPKKETDNIDKQLDSSDSPKSDRKTRSSISKLNNDEEITDTPKKETDNIDKQLDSSTVNDQQKINTIPQKGICKTQFNTPTSNEENKIDDSPKSNRKTRSTNVSKLNNDEEISDTPEKETDSVEKQLNSSKVNNQQKINETNTPTEEQKVEDSPKTCRQTRSSISKLNNDEEITDTPKKETENKKEKLNSTINDQQKIKETLQEEIDRKTQSSTPAVVHSSKSGRRTRSSISKLNTDEESSDTPTKETSFKEQRSSSKEVIKKMDEIESNTPTVSEKIILKLSDDEEEFSNTPKSKTSQDDQTELSKVNQDEQTKSAINAEQQFGSSPIIGINRKTRSSVSKLNNEEKLDTSKKEAIRGEEITNISQKQIKLNTSAVNENSDSSKIESGLSISTLIDTSKPNTSSISEPQEGNDTPQKEIDCKTVNEEHVTVGTNEEETTENISQKESKIDSFKESKDTPQIGGNRKTRLSTLTSNKEQDTPKREITSTESELGNISKDKISTDSSKNDDSSKMRNVSPSVIRRPRRRESTTSSLNINNSILNNTQTEKNDKDSSEDDNPNLSKNILSPIKSSSPKSSPMELRKKQNNSLLNIISSTPTALKVHATTALSEKSKSSESIDSFKLRISPEKENTIQSMKHQSEKNDSDLDVLELRQRSIVKSSPQKTPEKKDQTEEKTTKEEETFNDEETMDLLKCFVNQPKDTSKDEKPKQSLVEAKNVEEKATDASDESTDVEESNENQLKSKRKHKRSSSIGSKQIEKQSSKNNKKATNESTDSESDHVWKKKCKLAIQSDLPDSDESSDLSGYNENIPSKIVKQQKVPEKRSDSENDDKNEFIDNEAIECNDSRTPSPDENDIIEIGESISSDSIEDEDSDDYEIDSFVVSDELGNENDLLSGTGDDLSDGSKSDDSDLLLSQSKANKQAYNKKCFKKSRIIRRISDDESSDSITIADRSKESSVQVVNDDEIKITSSNDTVKNQLEINKSLDKQQEIDQQNDSSNENLEDSAEKLEQSLDEINKLHTILHNLSDVISENISKKKRRSSLSLSKITDDISEAVQQHSAKKKKLNDKSVATPEKAILPDVSIKSISSNKTVNKSLNTSDKKLEIISSSTNISPDKKLNKSLSAISVKSSSTSETDIPTEKLNKSSNSSNISLEIAETTQHTDSSLKGNSSIISGDLIESGQEIHISPKKLRKAIQSASVTYDEISEAIQETNISPDKNLTGIPESFNESTVSKKEKKLKNNINTSNISVEDRISAGSSEMSTEKKKKLKNKQKTKLNLSEKDLSISTGTSKESTEVVGKKKKLKNKQVNKKFNVSEEDVEVISTDMSEKSSEVVETKKKLKSKQLKRSNIPEEDANLISVGTSKLIPEKASSIKKTNIKKKKLNISLEEDIEKRILKKTDSKQQFKDKLQSNQKWLDENLVKLNVQLPSLLNNSFENSNKCNQTKNINDLKKRKINTDNQFEPTRKKSKLTSVEGFEIISLGEKIEPSKLGSTALNFKRQTLFGDRVPRQSSLDLINKKAKSSTINRRVNQ